MDVSFVFYDLIGCLWSEKNQKKVYLISLSLFADDAGMDFGCYGNNGIKTPNIDRLAKRRATF